MPCGKPHPDSWCLNPGRSDSGVCAGSPRPEEPVGLLPAQPPEGLSRSHPLTLASQKRLLSQLFLFRPHLFQMFLMKLRPFLLFLLRAHRSPSWPWLGFPGRKCEVITPWALGHLVGRWGWGGRRCGAEGSRERMRKQTSFY